MSALARHFGSLLPDYIDALNHDFRYYLHPEAFGLPEERIFQRARARSALMRSCLESRNRSLAERRCS
jgi:hypothetical protein